MTGPATRAGSAATREPLVASASLSLASDDADLQERLAAVLGRHFGRPAAVRDLVRFPAGFSWRTYGFSSAPSDEVHGRPLILRIAPADGLLPPYRAGPEFLALTAIGGQEIPIAEPILFSDDPAELGAPFLISARAAGRPPLPWTVNRDGVDNRELRGLAEQFVDALARLHAFEWRSSPAAGLQENVREDDVAARQVTAWMAILARTGLEPHPILADAESWLLDNAPAAPRLSLLHGDYRLGNFLAESGRITAILDWEMVHVGDPHEDLGWMTLPLYNAGQRSLFGALALDEALDRYEGASGIAVRRDSLRWHEIHALLKSAIIALSGGAAFEGGRLGDLRLAVIDSQARPLLRQLLKRLDAIG